MEDLEFIHKNISEKDKYQDSTILITGCAGFLGYSFVNYFVTHYKSLGIKKVIALDNFLLRKPHWLSQCASNYPNLLEFHQFDITSDVITNLKAAKDVDFVIHMASIASPTFYRKYPIQTIDANVIGLKNLLNFFKDKTLRGFLFFSSSEIYGDPPADQIPTNEEYRGNVACIGPRACYDEAKRIGETYCYNFAKEFQLPITIVRPFNNYGPGMALDDKRVPADFASAVLNNSDITLFSDGTPTRTFCYVADAIVGYLKVLTNGKFDYFNIGMDKPEISVKEFAEINVNIGAKLFGNKVNVVIKKHPDHNYLKDNPNRRCPDISKARDLLGFAPQISVQDGVERFIKYLHQKRRAD